MLVKHKQTFSFRLQNFGRIFVEMAESLLEFLINGPRTADESDLASFETLDLLLMMAEHHDYSVNSAVVGGIQ